MTLFVLATIASCARFIWASPTTALGAVILIAGAWRVRLRIVDGVLEAHGPALAWLLAHVPPLSEGPAAMTLGHIVVARNPHALEATRVHERVHVRQCEVWGPLFVPAYVTASIVAVLGGGHFYFDNRFEVEAFRTESADRTR